MKNDRQTILLEIIEQEAVETQEQLLRRLAERGVKCTQATVSRDIKQLHLVKEPTGHGRYRYAVSVQKTMLNFAEKLRTIFRECVLSVASAQNLVVLKTIEGMAQGAAFALDNMAETDIVGTLAGDDTILLVFHDNVRAVDKVDLDVLVLGEEGVQAGLDGRDRDGPLRVLDNEYAVLLPGFRS